MDRRSAAVLQAGAAALEDAELAAALRRLARRASETSEDEDQPLEGVEQKNTGQKE